MNPNKDSIVKGSRLPLPINKRHINVDYYNAKLNEYKTYGPNPASTELSSEAHFRLAIELFGDGGYPLGEFEEKEASPFVANSGSSSGGGISSYVSSFSDIKSLLLSLSSLKKWGSNHILNTKAKIQRSASRRQQRQRRKKRGNRNEMEDLAWEHIGKAADLGHADAQYVLGNAYMSGLFWGEAASSMSNGGRNVSIGIAHWHMAAIGGNIEAAVNLGFRYYSSHEKEEDYGVAVLPGQRCKLTKAYYEEAAHGVIDTLEAGPSRGKITPSIDRHKLSEIFVAGTSSGLAGYNKPDELQEALEYYRLRALSVNPLQPTAMDVHAALTLAQFHHYGLRGVLQDLSQALKFYEIAADGGNREAAGQAGTFHFFGLGYDDYSNVTSFTTTSADTKDEDEDKDEDDPFITTPFDETLHPIQFGNLHKAHAYLIMATSTKGIDECLHRAKKKDEDDICDAEGLNGMGLLHLFGLPGVIQKNRSLARRYFGLAKESGSMDATFHLALLYMGWMQQPVSSRNTNNDMENYVEEEVDEVENDEQIDNERPMRLEEMKFIDADGNVMPFEDIAPLLGPYGQQLLDQLNGNAMPFENAQGVNLGEVGIDGDVMGPGDMENIPAEVRGVLQKIALAAARGAGKADVLDEEFETESGIKIQTKIVYANKRPSNSDDKGPSSTNSGRPTKADYERAIHELSQAASNRHIQAAHRLATIYSHGIPHPQNPDRLMINKNCEASVRLFKQVTDNAPFVSRRSRRAYKQYMAGDVTSSLLNYLVLAEGGSEIGQLNAAWLLEQGYCLHMSKRNCIRASLRMWRAAARQGSSEASLRVGDFYYYGRMSLAEQEQPLKDDDEFDMALNELWYNKLYRWILYPEQMIKEGRVHLIRYIKHVLNTRTKTQTKESVTPPSSQTCIATDDQTCIVDEQNTPPTTSPPPQQDMATAALYYRKAAQTTSNARANFNLAYMHEWGLGLKQDFPLAKRHYDLARNSNREAYVVIQISLFSMNAHEKMMKFWNFLKLRWEEQQLDEEDSRPPKRGGYLLKRIVNKYIPRTYHPRWKLVMSHVVVLDGEMFCIILLSLVLIKFLMAVRQRRV